MDSGLSNALMEAELRDWVPICLVYWSLLETNIKKAFSKFVYFFKLIELFLLYSLLFTTTTV